MTLGDLNRFSGLTMVVAFAVSSTGCNRSQNEATSGIKVNSGTAPSDARETADSKKSSHNYLGRDWCGEHGVPESACALCDFDLVAQFKKDGDWCDEHDRPDSQCFSCHPEHEATFAAHYEAKYGEKPPARAEDAPHHDHDHPEGEHDDASEQG